MPGRTQEQVRGGARLGQRDLLVCTRSDGSGASIRGAGALDWQVWEPQHEVVADGFDDHVAGVIWAVFL